MKQTKSSARGRVFPAIVISYLILASLVLTGTALSQTRKADAGPNSGVPALPQYEIFDLGLVQPTDTASQGFGVSPGGWAVGRSVRTGGAQAFTWFVGTGTGGLPNLPGRDFCVANGANDNLTFVGTCASTLFGTSRLPVIWHGKMSQLPLPAGETLGDANDVNSSGVAVGSVDSGSAQQAVIYNGATATVITQTTTNGCFFNTAFGINDSGRVVGTGIDPNNAARNVGMVYDVGQSSAFEVGALPGANGALAFGIGNGGHVVGSSMMNQGSGLPFIWTQAGGMVAIPLPAGTTQGSARGVNKTGRAVGTASSAFAIPFYYDGAVTYRLADLLPPGTGWDLSTNTSSSAMGISDGNVIVGTGVLNGAVHAYAMVPVPGSIGGRILTSGGAGIPNAMVTLTSFIDPPVTVQTGSFGWYNFPGLRSGTTYTVTVATKRYVIAQPSRFFTLAGNVTDFDFVAEPR
jgi:uncharacterized membrane protein